MGAALHAVLVGDPTANTLDGRHNGSAAGYMSETFTELSDETLEDASCCLYFSR